MTYYEGVDYFIKKIEFPNMASAGVAASNGDGTFTIFINSLFCEEKQQEAIDHELRHLKENHFYREDNIYIIESEAKNIVREEMSIELCPDLRAAGLWLGHWGGYALRT